MEEAESKWLFGFDKTGDFEGPASVMRSLIENLSSQLVHREVARVRKYGTNLSRLVDQAKPTSGMLIL